MNVFGLQYCNTIVRFHCTHIHVHGLLTPLCECIDDGIKHHYYYYYYYAHVHLYVAE